MLLSIWVRTRRILHSLSLVKEEGPYFGHILALGEHIVSKTETARLYSVLLDAFFVVLHNPVVQTSFSLLQS